MAQQVEFELVSPEKLLLSEAADMVVVPGGEGDFGVLAQHAPMLSTVRPGVISVYHGDKVTRRIFVAGGFAEVTEERLTVLAEEALPVEEIDVEATRKRLKNAQEDLQDAEGDVERAQAARAVEVAGAMLEAAEAA